MEDSSIYITGAHIRKKIWEIWGEVDQTQKILEKFRNINGKTSQYDVPDELFQKRTSRSNRVLLRWKVLKKNKISLQQLQTFYGGVCVEFVNEDFYEVSNKSIEEFNYLVTKIGSDEKISAILTFRNEDGDSGSSKARNSYQKYFSEPGVEYSPIKRNSNIKYVGKGDNSVWEGNYYYSIKGGSQDSFESHLDLDSPTLFNPAVDYANELVCLDIDITMSYFALHCFDLDRSKILNFNRLISEIEDYLKSREYFESNLLSYCKNHYSLKWGNGYLIDPIQLKKMSIEDFKTTGFDDSSVVCHDEAANKYNFYFDNKQNFILSPARPTNFFWAKKLSNMMQQNFSLDEYFKEEENRYLNRKEWYIS
jgi:hypothetical protein